MKVDFARWAHECVTQSHEDIKQEQYLKSWGRSLEARIYFVADTIVRIVQVCWSLLKTAFSAMAALYVWNHEYAPLHEHLSELSDRVHLLIFALLGILTPHFSTKWKDTPLLERLTEFVQPYLPTRLILSARGGISFSFPLTQRAAPVNVNDIPKEKE